MSTRLQVQQIEYNETMERIRRQYEVEQVTRSFETHNAILEEK
jgi:hypothetical protein